MGASMTNRKKWLIGATLLLLVLAIYLWAFTLMSTAHHSARAAIAKSALIAASVGDVRQVVLVGVRQKLKGYQGTSCTRATYLVVGSSGVSFAVVGQLLPPGAADWQLRGVSTGWSSTGGGAC